MRNKCQVKIINFLFVSFVLIKCQAPDCDSYSDQQLSEFELTLDVRPSFTPNVSYKLKKFPGGCELNNIVYQLNCTDSILAKYFVDLENVISKNMKRELDSTDSGWLDGTTSSIRLKYLDSSNIFEFDNSGENEILNDFIPPIYNIIHYLSNTGNSELKMTIEDFENFELSEESVVRYPIRLVSEQPRKYRLYRRVYYCCYEEVIELFNSFPDDQLTYIEVSRFYSINRNDRFYDAFVNDIVSRKNIRWIVENESKQELIDLGIPRRNMVTPD